jgi:hypothetical protein
MAGNRRLQFLSEFIAFSEFNAKVLGGACKHGLSSLMRDNKDTDCFITGRKVESPIKRVFWK